jgi:hypothetical protein
MKRNKLQKNYSLNKKFMKIVIGTMSSPKVKAIEEGIKKCVYFEKKEIEIITLKADS